MASKVYTFQMDLIYKLGFAPIKLVRGDTRANIFNVTLTEENTPIDLTGSVISITMDKPDDTVVVGECQIIDAINGKVQYICGTNETAVLGTVMFTFEIYKEGSRVTTTQGKFKVVDQLDNVGDIASFTDYPLLGQLMKDLTVAENIRVSSENTRVSSENTRINSEDTRISNENIRQSQETLRQSVFNTNENNRQNTFNANESNRQNTFNANENIRQANEDLRINNENNRVTEFGSLKTASENATQYAISRGNYANEQGNNANEATTELRDAAANYQDVVDKSKKIHMPLVDTYNDILTTYPIPQIGWTVTAKDTHIEYRYDGVEWVDIGVSDAFQGYNVWVGPTPPNNVNLLWVYTSKVAEGYMSRIIPSTTEPIDKTQIWLKLT